MSFFRFHRTTHIKWWLKYFWKFKQMITRIELNPKDMEQQGDMNSNFDWDCDQVIGLVRFWLNYWSWICWMVQLGESMRLRVYQSIFRVELVCFTLTSLMMMTKPVTFLIGKKMHFCCSMKYLWQCSYTFLFVSIFLNRWSLYYLHVCSYLIFLCL